MRNSRHQQDWLKTFTETFRHTEVPEKYVYWVGVGTIGAALQRNVCFPQRPVFVLYPNHYIILTGPPAVKKTTAINFGVNLLRLVPGVHVGPSSVTWQNLVDELNSIQTPTAEEVARTGIAVRDSCPMVLPAGELGTLIDFEERASIDFFTSAWESPDTFDKRTRIMGKQQLNGPCLSIFAGTTPQWIKDNVKGATRGGGFISRCIMPYASDANGVVTYPDEHVTTNYTDQLSYLVHDLAIISQLRGDYRLSDHARKLGKAWDAQTKEENRRNATGADSDNWVARKYVHVHKLAMILAAGRRDELVIEEADMLEAISRIDGVGNDFNNVFALMDVRKETKGVREVESLIAMKGSITHVELLTKMREKFTKREIQEAITVLQGAKIIESEPTMLTIKTPQGPSVQSVIVHTFRGHK